MIMDQKNLDMRVGLLVKSRTGENPASSPKGQNPHLARFNSSVECYSAAKETSGIPRKGNPQQQMRLALKGTRRNLMWSVLNKILVSVALILLTARHAYATQGVNLDMLQPGNAVEVFYKGNKKWYPATYNGLDKRGRVDKRGKTFLSFSYDDTPNVIRGTPNLSTWIRMPMETPLDFLLKFINDKHDENAMGPASVPPMERMLEDMEKEKTHEAENTFFNTIVGIIHGPPADEMRKRIGFRNKAKIPVGQEVTVMEKRPGLKPEMVEVSYQEGFMTIVKEVQESDLVALKKYNVDKGRRITTAVLNGGWNEIEVGSLKMTLDLKHTSCNETQAGFEIKIRWTSEQISTDDSPMKLNVNLKLAYMHNRTPDATQDSVSIRSPTFE